MGYIVNSESDWITWRGRGRREGEEEGREEGTEGERERPWFSFEIHALQRLLTPPEGSLSAFMVYLADNCLTQLSVHAGFEQNQLLGSSQP